MLMMHLWMHNAKVDRNVADMSCHLGCPAVGNERISCAWQAAAKLAGEREQQVQELQRQLEAVNCQVAELNRQASQLQQHAQLQAHDAQAQMSGLQQEHDRLCLDRQEMLQELEQARHKSEVSLRQMQQAFPRSAPIYVTPVRRMLLHNVILRMM